MIYLESPFWIFYAIGSFHFIIFIPGTPLTEELSQAPFDLATPSGPPVEMPIALDFEVAPLPDLDRQDLYQNLPIPPVQPPLKIVIDESSERTFEKNILGVFETPLATIYFLYLLEGVKLKFDADQINYPCEPAVSYELFSYASSDVDPRFGLTSSVWQRVSFIPLCPSLWLFRI